MLHVVTHSVQLGVYMYYVQTLPDILKALIGLSQVSSNVLCLVCVHGEMAGGHVTNYGMY